MRLFNQIGLVVLGAAGIIASLVGLVVLGGTWGESGAGGKAILLGVIGLGAVGLYTSHRALEKMRSFDADESLREGLHQAAEFRGDHLEASVRSASIVLMVVLTLFVAAMAVACVGLLLSGRKGSLVPGLLGVPLFALVAAYASQVLWRACFSGRPWLRMDTRVIDVLPYGAIPWQDVVAMRTGLEMQTKRPVLTLVVRQPGRYLRGNWLNRMFAGGQLAADIGELRIPVGLLDVHHATVSEAARQLRARVQPPLLEAWIPGMTGEQARQQLRNEEIMRRMTEIAGNEAKVPDAAELAEAGRLSEELVGSPNPLAPALEANARRGKRLLWLMFLVFGVALALQVYRILRVL